MNQLKAKRLERKMSQSQLSKASGVPVRVIRAWEQGTRDIKNGAVVSVARLALVLNCNIFDLL